MFNSLHVQVSIVSVVEATQGVRRGPMNGAHLLVGNGQPCAQVLLELTWVRMYTTNHVTKDCAQIMVSNQSETMKPIFSEKFVRSTYSYWLVMT